jgi:hypothetical protein|eukprot:7376892-Prymnesium_polylepis.1
MEAVQGELQSGLVSELGSRFGAATLNEMKQGQRPITDLAADTAAAVRAFAAGEATGSVMMAPVNVLFRVCAHTAMRANVGTLTGDALEQSLKNDMEKINEKLDHLMSAEHEARKFELRALVNRIPIIMKSRSWCKVMQAPRRTWGTWRTLRMPRLTHTRSFQRAQSRTGSLPMARVCPRTVRMLVCVR